MQRRFFFAGLAFALGAILSQGNTAHADGTLSIGGGVNSISPSPPGGNLSNLTSLSALFTFAENDGTGAYSAITAGPPPTIGSGFTLTISDLSAFTFSIGGFTWTSNSSSYLDTITSQGAGFLSVYLRGNFDGIDSSINFSATDTSGSISSSFTLHTPAIPLPEPSSIIMGLTGVLGCGLLYGVRRRSVKAAA